MEVRLEVGNIDILTDTHSKFGFQLVLFPLLYSPYMVAAQTTMVRIVRKPS